jgi:signal peptidase II
MGDNFRKIHSQNSGFSLGKIDRPPRKCYDNSQVNAGGSFMQYLFMLIFGIFAVAADQVVKLLVVANIPPHTVVDAIPGLFHLTYVKNTGAAFSMLQGQQWLFALVFLVLTGLIIFEFWKNTLKLTNFERWCVAAIWAGGLGNMIDRLRLGYVIDMIEVEFMRFPVFNVADCFITCGAVLFIASLLLFRKDGGK